MNPSTQASAHELAQQHDHRSVEAIESTGSQELKERHTNRGLAIFWAAIAVLACALVAAGYYFQHAGLSGGS